MTATGGVLKVLPLQKSALASSRKAWRTRTGLLSASAARTSQPKSAHNRSSVSATTTGTPPAGIPTNQHEPEPISPAPNPDPRPRAVSNGKLPANYDATARRVLTIMVGLPIFIVTSYVLFERLVLKKERKLLVPRPEQEKKSATNDDLPLESPITQPNKWENLR